MKLKQFYQMSIVIGVPLGLLFAAIEYYPARELMAAFIIFTVLVAMIGAPLAVLILLEELAVEVLSHTGARMVSVPVRNRAI